MINRRFFVSGAAAMAIAVSGGAVMAPAAMADPEGTTGGGWTETTTDANVFTSQGVRSLTAAQKAAIYNKAYSKYGARYVWGAKGPTTFDCSGLVQWAYKQVTGVTLPPNTARQTDSRYTSRIVQKTGMIKWNQVAQYANKGDLVYMYERGRVSHVGFYSGGGYVLNASQSYGGVVNIPMIYFPTRKLDGYKIYTLR